MTRPFEQFAARLLPLCLLLACEGEPMTPSAAAPSGGLAAAVTDNVVASLRITPDSQMVFVGDQFLITAQPRNKAGQVLDKSVRWTVSNTSVATMVGLPQPAMTFKAAKIGKTSIKATVDGKSRFSKVVVRGVTGAKVVVTPAAATVAGGATVQFIAKGLTGAGETAAVNVGWTTTGGSISAGGTLTAGTAPGTFPVIATSAFGAADTSLVTITGVPDEVSVVEVILTPASASVAAGATVQFEAYGHTTSGDSVAVPATYTATGGTITQNGRYTAGGVPGTYRVVASVADLADTSTVQVSAAPVGRVQLLPDIAASRPGETTRFVASVFNDLGTPVSEPVTYATTCGTVSGTGVFNGPLGGASGSCIVTAAAGEIADTTEVVLLPDVPGQGVPFGVNDFWVNATTTRSSGAAAFTASREFFPASEMVGHIQAARAKGVHLVLVMTGASHDRYKTNGVFDQAKWQAAMETFNTQAIRDAVAEGVADGTIIGNSVMDEPQQSGTTTKDWGPPGTMTKARVDQLCAYVKNIFPTLPVGVGHDHNAFEPSNSYQVCEFYMPQYAARKGSVTAWRDAALAMAARDGMEIILSMNLLDGGPQDKIGAWDCPGTGGIGTHSPNCRMSPEQVREVGRVLGPAGCALVSWRYESTFMGKPENQAALSDIAIRLSGLPRRTCGRKPT